MFNMLFPVVINLQAKESSK